MSSVEAAAQSKDDEELKRKLDMLISLVPKDEDKQEFIELYGEEKIQDLLSSYPNSFDIVKTSERMGLLPKL